MEIKPIKIRGNEVYARTAYDFSLRALSNYFEGRYPHEKSIVWKNGDGKLHRIRKGDPKSLHASKIIDLRIQFSTFLYNSPDFDPLCNPVVGAPEKGSFSSQDFIYEYHFVHRHGFPSDVRGSGRGQKARAEDISNRPLSYLLMKNDDHEQYDRETGEWRNPKNHRNHKDTDTVDSDTSNSGMDNSNILE